MSETNYQELREAAEKATWGDWDSYKPHRGARGYEVRLSSQAIAQHVLKNNAEFIAAFNPKVALALLDELESNSGALVAECQNKKAALEAILSHLPINHPDIDIACVANIAHNELGEAKSSISEAYLVEIQAQGLEAFALTMRDTGDDPFFDSVASACADAADRFAALLRKGQSCLRPNFEGER